MKDVMIQKQIWQCRLELVVMRNHRLQQWQILFHLAFGLRRHCYFRQHLNDLFINSNFHSSTVGTQFLGLVFSCLSGIVSQGITCLKTFVRACLSPFFTSSNTPTLSPWYLRSDKHRDLGATRLPTATQNVLILVFSTRPGSVSPQLVP